MEIVEMIPKSRTFKSEEFDLTPQYSMPERIAAFKRPTILIFEESREMQEHYKQFLKSDYNLLMVETAAYGIKMLQSLPVDLILFNVEQDREVEAIGMLKVFRKMASGASIPVIAMTGYSGSQERAMLYDARFDAYLPRPFTLQQLRTVISRCLAKRTISVLHGFDLSALGVEQMR